MFSFVGLLVLSEIKIHLITIQTFLFLVVFFLNFGSGFKNVFICPNMLTTFNLSEMSSVMQENCVLEHKSPIKEKCFEWSSLNKAQKILLWLPSSWDDPGRWLDTRDSPSQFNIKTLQEKIPVLFPALLQICIQSSCGAAKWELCAAPKDILGKWGCRSTTTHIQLCILCVCQPECSTPWLRVWC